MAAELKEHHRAELLGFMRFAQGRRQLGLRGVAACFADVCEGRLRDEETYTGEEVRELLAGLRGAVLSELELELLHSSHTSALLLRQLYRQAEDWHLRLRTDLSQLEDRQLLEEVAELEHAQEAGPAKHALGEGAAKPRLVPINEQPGPAHLLHNEISRLQEENDKLRARLRTLEGRATAALEDKNALEQRLHSLLQGEGRKEQALPPRDDPQLENALAKLKLDFQKTLEERGATQRQLEEELTATKHQLLRTREQLSTAERELHSKFQDTAAYRNMKDMLARKNEQIRQLRHAQEQPQD